MANSVVYGVVCHDTTLMVILKLQSKIVFIGNTIEKHHYEFMMIYNAYFRIVLETLQTCCKQAVNVSRLFNNIGTE